MAQNLALLPPLPWLRHQQQQQQQQQRSHEQDHGSTARSSSSTSARLPTTMKMYDILSLLDEYLREQSYPQVLELLRDIASQQIQVVASSSTTNTTQQQQPLQLVLLYPKSVISGWTIFHRLASLSALPRNDWIQACQLYQQEQQDKGKQRQRQKQRQRRQRQQFAPDEAMVSDTLETRSTSRTTGSTLPNPFYTVRTALGDTVIDVFLKSYLQPFPFQNTNLLLGGGEREIDNRGPPPPQEPRRNFAAAFAAMRNPAPAVNGGGPDIPGDLLGILGRMEAVVQDGEALDRHRRRGLAVFSAINQAPQIVQDMLAVQHKNPYVVIRIVHELLVAINQKYHFPSSNVGDAATVNHHGPSIEDNVNAGIFPIVHLDPTQEFAVAPGRNNEEEASLGYEIDFNDGLSEPGRMLVRRCCDFYLRLNALAQAANCGRHPHDRPTEGDTACTSIREEGEDLSGESDVEMQSTLKVDRSHLSPVAKKQQFKKKRKTSIKSSQDGDDVAMSTGSESLDVKPKANTRSVQDASTATAMTTTSVLVRDVQSIMYMIASTGIDDCKHVEVLFDWLWVILRYTMLVERQPAMLVTPTNPYQFVPLVPREDVYLRATTSAEGWAPFGTAEFVASEGRENDTLVPDDVSCSFSFSLVNAWCRSKSINVTSNIDDSETTAKDSFKLLSRLLQTEELVQMRDVEHTTSLVVRRHPVQLCLVNPTKVIHWNTVIHRLLVVPRDTGGPEETMPGERLDPRNPSHRSSIISNNLMMRDPVTDLPLVALAATTIIPPHMVNIWAKRLESGRHMLLNPLATNGNDRSFRSLDRGAESGSRIMMQRHQAATDIDRLHLTTIYHLLQACPQVLPSFTAT